MKFYLLKFILITGVLLGLVACGGGDTAPAPTENIVQLNVSDEFKESRKLLDYIATTSDSAPKITCCRPIIQYPPTNTATIATLVGETQTAANLAGNLN